MKRYLALFILVSLLAACVPKLEGVMAVESEAETAAGLVAHTVTKDNRVDRLEAYLASQDSPMTDQASHFVAEADRLKLDWKLTAAIAGVESTFGKHIPTASFNGWGWGVFTGTQSGVYFKDWKDGITQVSEGIRYNYIDKGAESIEQIGRIYAASGAWSWKVHFFLDQIEAFQPDRPDELDITI